MGQVNRAKRGLAQPKLVVTEPAVFHVLGYAYDRVEVVACWRFWSRTPISASPQASGSSRYSVSQSRPESLCSNTSTSFARVDRRVPTVVIWLSPVSSNAVFTPLSKRRGVFRSIEAD